MKNCNQKRYEFHMQNDHYRRMVHDPEYFKGTEEDVSKISLLLALAQRPREEIVGFRRKYRALLHDCEEEFMTQFGLNYYDHIIERIPFNQNPWPFRVNGFTVTQWQALTDDNYFPPIHIIEKMIKDLSESLEPDDVALTILRTKYALCNMERESQLLAAHNIPPDTPYITLDYNHIDGITYNVWHLLHDDNYPINKGMLSSSLVHLRRAGQIEVANQIEEKYFSILHPGEDPFTAEEIAEAKYYFEHLLDD